MEQCMRKLATKNPRPKKSKQVNGSIADWIDQYAVDPKEVRRFCLRTDLFLEGKRAIKLAQLTLKPRRLQVQLEGDPEGCGEWLVIDVDILGPVDKALEVYHICKEKWMADLCAPNRGLIRLVYNIV
jgi:hypothetical protein